MRYSRFSNRFEHLVSVTGSSGAAFLYEKNMSPGSPANSRWDSGCTPVCSTQPASRGTSTLHAVQRNQPSIVGAVPIPPLASWGILEWLRLRPRCAFEPGKRALAAVDSITMSAVCGQCEQSDLSKTTFSRRQLSAGRIFISGLNDRQPLAENHHPGGTGPPEPRESQLVQAALPSLNLLNTMQLKKLPLGARHWHSACSL